MQGYIKLYRQIVENPIWLIKPFSEGQAWIDLLCLATYDKGFIKSKNGQIIKLERGDCGYSILSLSERWGWSRGKVTRFLSLLNGQQMIQQKTYGKHTIINIINFDKFQNRTTNDTTNDTTNGQQMIQQTDTINKVKNDKNDKNVFFISEKTKKIDSYTNSLNSYFCKQYQLVFGTNQTVFLSAQNRNRLSELAADYEDIRDIIPQALRKLKDIDFKDIDFTPSASWLLRGDNFERVMNGEFDKKKAEKTWQELLMEKAKERGMDECS